jgi:hypothetical protein
MGRAGESKDLLGCHLKEKKMVGSWAKKQRLLLPHSFLWLNYVACIHHISPSFTDAHLGCFHFLVSGYYE